MMTDEEFHLWCQRLQLSKETEAFITRIRSSPPDTFYQSKVSREHIIPLIDQAVVETIQAQQQEIRERYANQCSYLFPKPRFSTLPYKQGTFSTALNTWAVKCDIRDRNGSLWRFQSHQFRHTVGMRLINEDVPLDVIRQRQ